MAGSVVRNEQELRAIIKAPPGTVTAKVMGGPLRAAPARFLSTARLGVLAIASESSGPRALVIGGAAGFVTRDSSNGDLVVPVRGEQVAGLGLGETPPAFGGMLLMVPGVRHTLRVNGTVTVHESGESLQIRPAESYAHCAKAFIRSRLWTSDAILAENDGPIGRVTGEGPLDEAAVRFIESAPFAAIGTSLARSDADVSPRGDPAGFVQVIDSGHLFVPERPGNRIADSLRNIIANPLVSLLLMAPGDHRVLEVVGDAVISTDEKHRATARVNEREPKMGIHISVRSARLSFEPALEASGAWDQTSHAAEADLPTIGAMVSDPNQARSVTKRALIGLTDRVVEFDYKRNLY